MALVASFSAHRARLPGVFAVRGPFDRDILVQGAEKVRMHDAQAVKSHGRRSKLGHSKGSGSKSKAGAVLFCSIMIMSKTRTLSVFENELVDAHGTPLSASRRRKS